MIPDGWTLSALREVVNFVNGKAHEKDISENGSYIVVNSKYISSDGNVVKLTDSCLCPASENDILMVMSDIPNGKAIAKCFFVSENNKYTVNQRVARFTPNNINPKFLYYFINRNKYYLAFDDGVKQTNLRKDEVLDCPVYIPPKLEQDGIADILTTWDKAIEIAEKLIVNSQQQKKALMQQMLTGEKRLPGFKDDFSRKHMGEISNIDTKSLNNKTPDNFKFRYISLSDVETGRISKNLEVHDYAGSPSRARRIVKEGDILMATVRPNLQAFAMIDTKHADCISSTGFSVISPKESYHGSYIYHYLFGSHIKGQIHSLVVGSNYPAINSSDVKGLAIYCPEYEEQVAISNVLDNADKTIINLSRQLNHLRRQKNALMQQLLTGKRRVTINA